MIKPLNVPRLSFYSSVVCAGVRTDIAEIEFQTQVAFFTKTFFFPPISNAFSKYCSERYINLCSRKRENVNISFKHFYYKFWFWNNASVRNLIFFFKQVNTNTGIKHFLLSLQMFYPINNNLKRTHEKKRKKLYFSYFKVNQHWVFSYEKNLKIKWN